MSNFQRSRAQVGIVGAGQLARMTIQAGISLGVRIRLMAERPDDGAALISPDVVIGTPANSDDLLAFAKMCDVVTFDHELVPPQSLEVLEYEGICLRPSGSTMRLAQNKRAQRQSFASLGLPIPKFVEVEGATTPEVIAEATGYPVVLKAVHGGYDGRGVWVVRDITELESRLVELTNKGIELIAEEWVPIDREVAILVARRPPGEMAIYPLVETVQVDGICREVICPADVTGRLMREAEGIARTIAEASDVVGILAVELFVSGDKLIVNEIATRPHNSGHYTIEGCVTSQFEQHLRAVLDWPLGSTSPTSDAVVTVNILGGPPEHDLGKALPEALAVPGAHLHLYGKAARPGRKLGHVTVCGESVDAARGAAREAAELLSGASIPEAVRL